MNETYVVSMSNQDVVLRVSNTSFGQVRVTPSAVGHVQILGGVPGPQGLGDDTLLALHILDPTPHPPYDDQPSLSLYFENGLI